MKTPITYWGGKQQLAPKILSLIPQHLCYTEVFFGGGAVFFEKEKSKIEVINDINDNMVNFYRTIKRDFEGLQKEIDMTLYSEYQWKKARDIWRNGHENDTLRAWAVFVLSQQSFSSNIGSSWGFDDQKNRAIRFDTIKKMFNKQYIERLDGVQIFSRDALTVLANTDHDNTFHFIDPPYILTGMGHYSGYSEQDFENLLKLLSKLKGKFLLTSYPSDLLTQYTHSNGWKTIENKKHLSASSQEGKTKIEVFTMNYSNRNLFER